MIGPDSMERLHRKPSQSGARTVHPGSGRKTLDYGNIHINIVVNTSIIVRSHNVLPSNWRQGKILLVVGTSQCAARGGGD